eukprot:c18741_g1_i3 orf=348-1052(-)
MWQPVLLAILSAGGSTIGKVLQKKGTKGLPRLSLNLRVMQAYILNCTWGSGFLLDIFGALLMLKAVSQAPISIVQPVSGCGLAVLAVFSHFYLHEAMNPLDWLGVIIAIVGTIGVGMIGEGQRPSELHLKRLIWFIILAVFLFTTGLKEGRAVVVSTCAAIASIVTGVLVGIMALGETLPVSVLGRALLFVGWLFIIIGVVMLMDPTTVCFMLPRSFQKFMKLKVHPARNLNSP